MSWNDSAIWTRLGRAVLVVAVTAEAVHNGPINAQGGYLTPFTAAAVLCGITLLLRRPWWLPLAATLATAGFWGVPMLTPLLLALYDATSAGRLLAALTGAGLTLAANSLWRPDNSLLAIQEYGATIFLLIATVTGLLVNDRRRRVAALAAEVDHLRVERALRERAARSAERSAVAEEMHDVLAHRLSLIALHTGALMTRRDDLPEPVSERLALLRTAATEALADLRDVLGALHDDEIPAKPPAPTLRDVADLVDEGRAAGQLIELHVDGEPERVPATHRLAVARLVQEAMTNVRKHAPEATAAVRITYGPPTTVVEVSNSASARPATTVPSGYGLIGLRARVAALGGELQAGPTDSAAWLLSARIPHPDIA
ncbi:MULTISPECIES: sensor histidine kinase [unclassified Nocardia]|uniref:sensor histidine kinase n=1 Tax=unclassified Nocardia TaxID=2637762 RepID=UPI001CE41155|nr:MULTISPECIES: histidine kinase [unclassified Nocardia]